MYSIGNFTMSKNIAVGLLCLTSVSIACNHSTCELLSQLECALYTTDSNERSLNQAFFPPREATSRYINVNYQFSDTNDSDPDIVSNCTVHYIWAIGGFLLIQPPTIFQMTSLLFSYPANDIYDLDLTFPLQCRGVVHHDSETGGCSCGGNKTDNILDILTQQIMQYSKFNNPDSVVRDVSSTAQAICVDTLKDGYYKHRNVNLYLAAEFLLPIATSVVSTLIVWKHYEVIISYVKSKKKPNVVGAATAGIYITLYMFCMDISAAYYYISRRNEYGIYDTIRNSFSLQLTWFTLEIEYTASVVVLAFFWSFSYKRYSDVLSQRLNKATCLRKALYATFLSSLSIALIAVMAFDLIKLSLLFIIATIFSFVAYVIILCIFDISERYNDFLIYFIVLPIIFLSSHVNYIFSAWLTEPSKTTSVAILAITVILYLFIMSRSIYNCMKFEDERLSLLVTFVLGFLGVGLASLQIAAFYIIPIPAVHLADYLDNVFQISLVILAALISYKILSIEDSEASKFFKQFNRAHKKDTLPCKESSPYKSLKIEATVTTEFKWSKWTGKMLHNKLYLSTNLEKYNLYALLPGRDETKRYANVPISMVSLKCGPFPSKFEEVHFPLAAIELSFKVLSSDKFVTTNLKEASFEEQSIENYELRFVKNSDSTYSGTLFKSVIQCDGEDIITEPIPLSIQVPCCVIKNISATSNQGTCCRFDNFISIDKVSPNNTRENLLKTWDKKVSCRSVILGDSTSIRVIPINAPTNGIDVSISSEILNLNDPFCSTDTHFELEWHRVNVKYTLQIIQKITLKNTHKNGHNHLVVSDNANRKRLSLPAPHIQNGCTSVILRATTLPTITTSQDQSKRCKEKFTLIFNPDSNTFEFSSDIPGQGIEVANEETLQIQNFSLEFVQYKSNKTVLKAKNGREGQVPNRLKVTFSANNHECKLSIPISAVEAHLHTLKLQQGLQLENRMSSFLYFPSGIPDITPDEFEDAGFACGEAVLRAMH